MLSLSQSDSVVLLPSVSGAGGARRLVASPGTDSDEDDAPWSRPAVPPSESLPAPASGPGAAAAPADAALPATLLAAVAHDLRAPLAAIKAAVSALLHDPALPAEERRALLAAIDSETDRLAGLMGQLLDLSRLEGRSVQPARDWHDVAELLAELVQRLDPRRERVVLHVPAERPLGYFDYPLVERAVSQLVDNALKYSPPAAPVEVAARIEGGRLWITVADRGPGIAPAERERIFERFYRLSAGGAGLGLGLTIARGLARAHGGDVTVAERAGGGSVFTLWLPVGEASC
jgi:two-component system sensor histidine kinase KdpD